MSKEILIIDDDPDSVSFDRCFLEDRAYQDKPIEPDNLIRAIKKIMN